MDWSRDDIKVFLGEEYLVEMFRRIWVGKNSKESFFEVFVLVDRDLLGE